MITSWSKQLDASSALSSTFGYDSADQLISASVPLASGPTPQAYQYQYDLAGNRTSEQIDPVVTSSSYNNLNQLLSQAGGGNMVFNGKLTSNNNPVALTLAGQPATVDTSGNWRGAAPVTVGSNSIPLVATDANGKTTTKTITIVVSGGANRTLTYDLNGILFSDGAGKTYTYDAVNRMVSVTQNGITIDYVYDGMGRRVQETSNGTVVKQWVWCGRTHPCEERDGNNNIIKRFYAQGEQIGGANYYYAKDRLGSVREMTDSTGAIRARYDYDPYGRQTKLSGDLDADFGFCGYYNDTASGGWATKYRILKSDLGRWLSRDPIGERGGTNLYEYALANPVKWRDRLGLDVRLETTNQVYGLHQHVSVDTPDGPYNQSYGMKSRDLPEQPMIQAYGVEPTFDQAGSGIVYQDFDPARSVLMTFQTTPDEDAMALPFLQRELNMTGPYDVFTNSCRYYSQERFDTLVDLIELNRFSNVLSNDIIF